MFYALITTNLGSEKRACLEALDVLFLTGGYGECIETSFRGTVLLKLFSPVNRFYSGLSRIIFSSGKRIVPLVSDDIFIRRWLNFRGTIRPRCNERGVTGVCNDLLDVLKKINSNVDFTYKNYPLNLHIEVIGSIKGFFILPWKCDSLDHFYSSSSFRRKCLNFIDKETNLLEVTTKG